MSDWFKVMPGLRYRLDYADDHPLTTAALCKADRHPTLLGDVFAVAVARVAFESGGRTDLCRAHLDMLLDEADGRPFLEPTRIRWFVPVREQIRRERAVV